MCGSTLMTAEADTVMKSPSRAVRIDTCCASALVHATARANTEETCTSLMTMETACPAACSRATSADLLHADAGPLRQSEDRVAVRPGDRRRGGFAPRQPF